MEHEWNPTIRTHGKHREVWYKNPNRDKVLVITKELNLYEGRYQHSRLSTWYWNGKTHNEVLHKAIKDIEDRENHVKED